MTMTIGVYRINRETHEKTTLTETYTVTGNEPLPPTSELPNCSCERCGDMRAAAKPPQ